MPEHSSDPLRGRDAGSPLGSIDFEQRLVGTATALGHEAELDGLIGKLHAAMADLPGLSACGTVLYDEERELVSVQSAAPPTRSEAGEESTPIVGELSVVLGAGTARLFSLASPTVYVSADLMVSRSGQLDAWLHATGVRRYAAVPMAYQGKLLGVVYAGGPDESPIPANLVSFLERLGRVATPALWICQTHGRLARGDRRRELLIDLSSVISTSLQLETVVRSALEAIGALDDHELTAIDVVDDDGKVYRSYRYHRRVGKTGGGRTEITLGSVAPGATAWVSRQRIMYRSGDLVGQAHFAEDAELRSQGLRRYVVTPMTAHGGIRGVLFCGSTDPQPTRKVDLWMYEHIALQLALAINNAIQHEELQRLSDRLAQHNVYLREEIQREQHFGGMIGRSAAMRHVFEEIARVAQTNSTVLITGETGVGKELVARAIHAAGPRADQPMIKVNCAAIPEGMVESELFGHERGAFTSAVERRIGRFELAQDGTLFLDEIGELSLAVQPKLLRVLQDGEFERVGGTKTRKSNATIIAATNRNLEQAVRAGLFRADLYYRVNVFPIAVPTLDQRPEDIPLLVEAFVAQLSPRMGKRFNSVDPTSVDYLCRRSWPGNVRELRHVIERAMILCDGPSLRVETDYVAVPSRSSPAGPARPATLTTLSDHEAAHIRSALERTGGVIEGSNGAAAILGIKSSTLRFRMKRLGIRRPVR